MWLILQQENPSDYVIATGVTTEVREFVRMAFAYIGIKLRFDGVGVDEQGIVDAIGEAKFAQVTGEKCLLKIGQTVVRVSQKYFRPTEVELLIGDPAKSKGVLGWKPEYDLQMLVDDMMESDVKLMKKDAYLAAGGYKTLNYFE